MTCAVDIQIFWPDPCYHGFYNYHIYSLIDIYRELTLSLLFLHGTFLFCHFSLALLLHNVLPLLMAALLLCLTSRGPPLLPSLPLSPLHQPRLTRSLLSP